MEFIDKRTPKEVKENKLAIARRIAKTNGKAKQCDMCEDWFLPKEIKENEEGLDVCPNCINRAKCDCCLEYKDKDELRTLTDINGEIQYENICENCEDSVTSDDRNEPVATVIYGNDDYPHTIGYYHDDTEGDFKAVYHRTDGWRGYYDIECSDDWEAVHSDCILSYSHDSENLKRFDELFRKALDTMGIKYARVFSRTSNIFSQGYDFFVEKGMADKVEALRVVLSAKLRDDDAFRATALTGKDPENLDEHDKLFVKASKLLEQGMNAEQAVEYVFGEMEE